MQARIRVGGMTDVGAQMRSVQIDATALDMAGMSTRMTDGGRLVHVSCPDGTVRTCDGPLSRRCKTCPKYPVRFYQSRTGPR
jgi:hypothetical protein